MQPAEAIARAERLVIKVGSSLLVHPERGSLHAYWLAGLAKDIVALHQAGKKLCVVSSGAVGLGRTELEVPVTQMEQTDKQAAAACGQMRLMRGWHEAFAEDKLPVAQVLLTLDDSESRRRYLNARHTLTRLLELGILPVINENDTVASDGIRVGDNDRLAARAAQMISADLLILLSDVPGLYTADPGTHPEAALIPEVQEITESIRAVAAPTRTLTGTGGMQTKVEAAAIATASGCHTLLGLGTVHRPIRALQEGGAATLFHVHTTPLSARKEWIVGALAPLGTLTIDAGAERALQAGNSLLPVGVSAMEGCFQRGDAVLVQGQNTSQALAKGLVCYDSEEMARIMGCQSAEIPERLGYARGNVVMHRDDMILLAG